MAYLRRWGNGHGKRERRDGSTRCRFITSLLCRVHVSFLRGHSWSRLLFLELDKVKGYACLGCSPPNRKRSPIQVWYRLGRGDTCIMDGGGMSTIWILSELIFHAHLCPPEIIFLLFLSQCNFVRRLELDSTERVDCFPPFLGVSEFSSPTFLLITPCTAYVASVVVPSRTVLCRNPNTTTPLWVKITDTSCVSAVYKTRKP